MCYVNWHSYAKNHPHTIYDSQLAPQLTPVRGIKCIPPRDVWLISSGGIPKSSDQDTSPRPPVKSHPVDRTQRVTATLRHQTTEPS